MPDELEVLDDMLIGNRQGFIALNRAVLTAPQSRISSLPVDLSPIVAPLPALATVLIIVRDGENPIAFELIVARSLSDFNPCSPSSFSSLRVFDIKEVPVFVGED
jgi:hypothetical protein